MNIEENIARGWADVEGFPGYRITIDGRILTCRSKAGRWGNKTLKDTWTEKKLEVHIRGYRVTRLCSDGAKPKRVQVHRCVAMHFVHNGNNKPQVNHIDGVTGNNHYSNLEWVTPSENIIHSFRVLNRNRAKGERQASSKLTSSMVYEIKKRLSAKESQCKLAKEFGVHQVTISNISLKKLWAHVQYP